MSGTSPPNVSPGGGGGFMGGWRTVIAVVGIVVLGLLGWLLLPERGAQTSRRTDPAARPGVVGASFNPPAIVDPAVQRAAAMPAVVRPLSPAAPIRRPRPSSMAVYDDPEPPARLTPATAPGNRPDGPEKIAGMTVLRAEAVHDATNYLMPGMKIACQNNEPLTERSGANFSANIPEDVFGPYGSWPPLIPKGSIAVGRVLRGLDHGERRLAAVLTHIRTPGRPGMPIVMVPLGDGQAGDALGGADLEGNIETHFWARLGAVAAYAGLDTVSRVGTAVAADALSDSLSNRGSGPNVSVNNFGGLGGGGGRSLAGRAFDHEIQRRPSFARPQAQPCTIFINQPIDFRAASAALRSAGR